MVMMDPTSQSRFFVRAAVGLAIDEAILTEKKVVVSFFGLSL